jgi:signal transduction histidine kinase
VRDRIFGRLYITEKEGGREFTKDDERIALTFAAQAGVAIDNARLYDEVRKSGQELSRRVAELSSVERVGDLLITSQALDDVLRSVVEEARKLTDAARSSLMLRDSLTGELVVRAAAGNLQSGCLGTRLPAGGSKAEAVMLTGRAEVVDDLRSDPEVHADTIRRLGDPRSGAFAPLTVRGVGIGTLAVYGHGDDEPSSGEELAVLQVLANQAAIAIENDRLTEALRDIAVLEERERISKELHDGVIQSIYSVGLSLQGSISLLRREPDLAGTRINQAIAELDNVVRDVRSYIFELLPKSVEELGLAAAVAELVKEFEVNTLAHVTLQFEDEACSLPDDGDQLHVVQIVREILSNIARHAHATDVELLCRRDGEDVEVSISDDGTGFDPNSVQLGHGLLNMEERARKLRGRLHISPRDGRGTRHTLRIPKGLVDD